MDSSLLGDGTRIQRNRFLRRCWRMTLIGLLATNTAKATLQPVTTKLSSSTAAFVRTVPRSSTRTGQGRQVSSLLSSSASSVVHGRIRKLPSSLFGPPRMGYPSKIPSWQQILAARRTFLWSSLADEATVDSGNGSLSLDEKPEDGMGDTSNKTPFSFVDFPFHYHELVDVYIESLTNRGWGVGRFDVSQRKRPEQSTEGKPKYRYARRSKDGIDHDDDAGDGDDSDAIGNTSTAQRWVVMVPNVIPGETVRVRIFRNFKRYSEGDLVHVLDRSPDRIEPRCAVAHDCGGCQLQHISIDAQRQWKRSSVQESLAQYGIHNVTVSPTIGTQHIFGYRSKLTPHYQAPAKCKRGDGIRDRATLDEAKSGEHGKDNTIQAIGFQRQTSRSIVDVTYCPIATEPVNAKYAAVRAELLAQPTTRSKGATLLFRQANVETSSSDDDEDVTPSQFVSTNHQEYLTTRVRGLDFTYQAGNFFQNNYFVLPLMVDHVVQSASSAEPTSPSRTMTHLVDCYCGSGLFALSAAAVFDTVVGIEINQKAVQEATVNAERNRISNCQFRAASAEAIFADIDHYPRAMTAVVLDPPRKGCSMDFLAQLLAFAPQRIVYMSCDPTTQARDAQVLLATGQYRLTSVQPFDLFPQTRHIECLAIFERA
jgi:tRNA (uracil-5-)-methyltransferase